MILVGANAMKSVVNKKGLQWRKTKIVATLGPASDSEKIIERLILAGVNVFRLNMSHGNHTTHRETFAKIRKTSQSLQVYTGILMDLCGPKIRVGEFEQGEITLKQNATVVVSCSLSKGYDNIIASQYKNLYKDVKQGDRILLDDGNIELRVESVANKEVSCKVIYGGILKDHKGMNLPDTKVSVASFTAKDKDDVALAMELDADFVALSFVRNARDVKRLKDYMKKSGMRIPVISKIEKPEAIENIDEIMQVSYAIMIARGDLGIELPAEQVPLIQKELINKARAWHRPVIVATQMMESMINNSRPTRAEVGDVANAALSSADAVMLSAETAVGKYPYKTVKTMDKILREIEVNQWNKDSFGEDSGELNGKVDGMEEPSVRYAIAHAARTLVHELSLKGIIVPTRSGITANIISSARPSAPILGLSSNLDTCRKMSLNWGVEPFVIDEILAKNWKVLVKEICTLCKLTTKNNKVLLVSGFNDDAGLSEPVIKILTV